MTVRELIRKLEELPQDLPVELLGEADCGYIWGGGSKISIRHLDAEKYDWLDLDDSVVRIYAFEDEPHAIRGLDCSALRIPQDWNAYHPAFREYLESEYSRLTMAD